MTAIFHSKPLNKYPGKIRIDYIAQKEQTQLAFKYPGASPQRQYVQVHKKKVSYIFSQVTRGP